jgi:hypothetical protein
VPARDIASALTELAKAGIAFTSEIGPKGEKIYIVDRVRLREAELLALQSKGALTKDGIRKYLVNRAA